LGKRPDWINRASLAGPAVPTCAQWAAFPNLSVQRNSRAQSGTGIPVLRDLSGEIGLTLMPYSSPRR
jgi:hypothetical protein